MTVILGWCHDTLIFHVTWSFALLSSNLSPLPVFTNCSLQSVQAHVFFYNFSSANLDFHKRSFICGWLLKAVRSRNSLTMATRGWNQFMSHFRLFSWDLGLCISCLVHGWVRVLLDPLVYGVRFHSSHKHTFVCEWMPNFCSWVRDVSCNYDTNVTPKLISEKPGRNQIKRTNVRTLVYVLLVSLFELECRIEGDLDKE